MQLVPILETNKKNKPSNVKIGTFPYLMKTIQKSSLIVMMYRLFGKAKREVWTAVRPGQHPGLPKQSHDVVADIVCA